MREIFIIGSKGIPAQYGGFETFVENLTAKKHSDRIHYHVACLSDSNEEFIYNNARCFKVKVPQIGSAKAVYYDIAALKQCIRYIKANHIDNAVIYILACRIGPFIGHYTRILHELGAHVYVNPDGHEWKRSKWNRWIQKYWKISERLMVKHAELLICDSVNIQKYIEHDYSEYHPRTVYIAYGADIVKTDLKHTDPKVVQWFKKANVAEKNYYLVVGRFVPENNYETMIREFMSSKTKKDLVLVTNIDKNKFYEELKEKTHFERDSRIKFVGTVYDQELLSYIRNNAYAYIHGHEVGGTNPSLLEALATTPINLLLGVGFNREVGKDGALYWRKTPGDLKRLIEQCDCIDQEQKDLLSEKAKSRISQAYDWNMIIDQYERVLDADFLIS